MAYLTCNFFSKSLMRTVNINVVLPTDKENEIKEYAKTSIPIFFKANLPQKDNEEPLVYWFSTGESLYRFFVNRLNGLKDENGKYSKCCYRRKRN